MKEVAELLLKTNAVTLRINPPYTWASGILAPIYTDNRILLSYPSEREKILDLFIRTIEENDIQFNLIAGVSTAGIPWAAWLAKRLNKPMVYVRATTKDHGKENLIEGRVEKGSRAVVIEDLISTGRSALSTVEALRDAGCKVEYCLTIFTYEFRSAKENFQKMACKLIALTDFSTLIELATGKGYLNNSDKQNVLNWSKDPEKWGR